MELNIAFGNSEHTLTRTIEASEDSDHSPSGQLYRAIADLAVAEDY